jgi:hypothetical protein
MDTVTKAITLACGCTDTVEVRPRESRLYLRVGMQTGCKEHGQQTITYAKEIDGTVPLLGDILKP